jgi:hypothetical protein
MAQGETGLDIVGRLATPRHKWFAGLNENCTTVILEAKGDRTGGQGLKINRPAYNEMTGGLGAFFLSNLRNIRDNPDRLYGWVTPKTFYTVAIQAFKNSLENIPIALPSGCAFLVGLFDGSAFWREAPVSLQLLARQWFLSKEGGAEGRNALLAQQLCRRMPEAEHVAEKLFKFELVRATTEVKKM